MPELDLILTLTGSLAAALVCGYGTFRLGLSPIVGYLLAGLVVGPNTPGFVANRHLADQLAEVGVILLMFGVGLQFHLEELLAVRRVAVPGAVGMSLVATLLGALVGVACGWGWSAGLVFGLALSVASTVVLMRVLADHGTCTPRPATSPSAGSSSRTSSRSWSSSSCPRSSPPASGSAAWRSRWGWPWARSP
jgi:CPA2 family monovalent cation:H+ antiporter-2